MKTIAYILLVVALLPANLSAQDNPDEVKYRYGIGGGAGFTTGYGLSFRYLPKRFGAQINFAPYSDSRTDRYSVGITFLYTLIEGRVSSLFLYQGNHYYYNSDLWYNYDPLAGTDFLVRSTESYVNNGLGFGIDITIAKRIGLNLMTGYAFYDNFNKLNVTGEAALFYKF